MAESVVTIAAKRKMVRARAGVESLTTIVGMAFGDGAVDVNGEVITPSQENTALKNELLRKTVDGFKEMSDTCYRYTCTLDKEELDGKYINEVALYDSGGDLVAIKSFLSKGKDGDMEMIFEIDDMF